MHSSSLRSAFLALIVVFFIFNFNTTSTLAQQGPRRRMAARASTVEGPSVTALPSPRAVLGFTPGDDRTIADWRQMRDYFERLDRASPHVLVETIGETTLKRPLIVAFISAPENIRDLQKYKDMQRRLADPRLVRDVAERDRLVREGKTIVAISCSIHATEIVASQMALQLAYELASAGDAETREILSHTILLLIPSANPDGHDIVAEWYRHTLGTPYEGSEPPELYHAYAGHDNNRDWFMLNLKETQAITRFFWKEWFPQIVYDVHQHGMEGARFFIPPFYDPPNPHIAPLLLREVGLIGHKIAADLQIAGRQGVITNALYDTWWHGGFRSAPYYHNSIGLLSEAASAKLMTPVTITPEQLAKTSSRGMPSALQAATNFPDPWRGGVWRPRDIMHLELSAARSVLSMAATYRARYLHNFYELGRRALTQTFDAPGAPQPPLAYLIPAGQGQDENVARMIGALVAQGVEVHRLDRELHATLQSARPLVSVDGAGGRPLSVADQVKGEMAAHQHLVQEVPANSYLVFLAQPYRANVQALFERQVYPDRRTAGGEAERPYDVAGWTLPMQMGVEIEAVLSIREPEAERRFTLIRDENEVRRDFGLPLPTGDTSPIRNPINTPVRLALYKSYAAVMDEGWTRFVFDTFNVPYQTLLDHEVRAGNLRARFDVIVLPSQRLQEIVGGRTKDSAPAKFTGGLTEAGVENLQRFVEAGGTLICFGEATELAIKRFQLPLRNVLENLKTSEFYGPGSIVRLDVDNAHPVARRMSRQVDAYFINSSAFEVTEQTGRVRVIARYAEGEVLRSGWLLGEEKLRGKAALVEVSRQRGRIILFGFRPQHRGQTWGTFPFIFNAISTAGSD